MGLIRRLPLRSRRRGRPRGHGLPLRVRVELGPRPAADSAARAGGWRCFSSVRSRWPAPAANGRRPSSVPLGWILAGALVAVGAGLGRMVGRPAPDDRARLHARRPLRHGGRPRARGAGPEGGRVARPARRPGRHRGGRDRLARHARRRAPRRRALRHDRARAGGSAASGRTRTPSRCSSPSGCRSRVWLAFDGRGWERPAGAGLVLLFAGEIAVSGSRGAVVAGLRRRAPDRGSCSGRRVGAKLAVAAGARRARGAPARDLEAPAPGEAGRRRRYAPGRGGHRQDEGDRRGARLSGSRTSSATRRSAATGRRSPRTLLRLERPRPGVGRAPLDQAAERPLLGYGFGTENRVFVDRFYAFEGGFSGELVPRHVPPARGGGRRAARRPPAHPGLERLSRAATRARPGRRPPRPACCSSRS